MRLLFVFLVLSSISFSQTNEVLINQAVQEAKNQNIKTKSQATEALKASGMTENEARQLARERGLSYDQLLNDYFSENNLNDLSDADNQLLDDTQEDEIEENTNEEEENKSLAKSRINGAGFFGYDIFNNNPFLNKEYLLGNIDEGYLISPGDEIRIITYGDNSFEQILTVDRNGNINIRNYGLFFAAGNSFKELKSRLKIFLGKYLSGLVSTPQKTFMDVSLTQLKPVKIVVLGQVNAPGPHILNTSGSALSALYAAGGVKTSGTLREIKIFRNNKLFKTIDLYDYITKGELKDDVRLTNNDIVFVDIRKNRFLLQGEVYNNAIYELKENEGLSQLLKYSGGLPVTAQTSKVNISRITPANRRSKDIIADRELITFDYQEAKELGKKINLYDGDKITFFRILDLELNQVKISGHVSEPGIYSLASFKDLKTLIVDAAKGVLPDVYLERVDVTSNINGISVLNSYNLNDILKSEKSVILNDMDQVEVFSNERVEGIKTVSISGYGVSNYTTKWKENLSIYDLIFSASEINNPEFLAELLQSRIDIKRFNNKNGTFKTLKFEFEDTNQLKSEILKPRDKVILFSKNSTKNFSKKVGIYGYINEGSQYDLEDEMYVEDLIMLAGGFMYEANQKELVVNRLEIDPTEERVIRKFNIKIDKDYLLGIKNKPDNNFILEDKDIVVIKQKEGFIGSQRIKVSGEVVFPQTVILEFRNSSFNDLLKEVGGLTKYANLKASKLIRNGELININLSKINNQDPFFKNGDEVFIASNEGLVETIGALENPSSFIWKKGKRAKYYIKNSAGKIASESDGAFLINPNGISKKIGFFKNPKVFPNSSIIVNRKVQKEKKERQKFDFNQTLGVIASALTSILLASRL